MKLSCIIPIYGLSSGENHRYFEDLLCAISIASAPLGDEFEMIVVNDDKDRISRQDIMALCKKHGIENKLVYKENVTNRGQAFSRNIGASIASGEYLHFIDQDDYISDNYYSEILKSGDETSIIISKPYFSKDDEIKRAYTGLLQAAYRHAYYLKDLWYLLISNVVYSPGQMLMPKKYFDSVGGFPVLSHRGADDFALFYNLVFGGDKIPVKFNSESIFYYRIHSQQNSKLSSTNLSACEFLSTHRPANLKQQIVYDSKMKRWVGVLCKIFYVLYYKRA